MEKGNVMDLTLELRKGVVLNKGKLWFASGLWHYLLLPGDSFLASPTTIFLTHQIAIV